MMIFITKIINGGYFDMEYEINDQLKNFIVKGLQRGGESLWWMKKECICKINTLMFKSLKLKKKTCKCILNCSFV